MSLAAALVLIAQSASPAAAEAPVAGAMPVAERARATVRILRPAQVRVARDGAVEVEGDHDPRTVQRSRDAAGTLWVEFS